MDENAEGRLKVERPVIIIILLPWWVVHSMHSAYVEDLHEIQE